MEEMEEETMEEMEVEMEPESESEEGVPWHLQECINQKVVL